MKQETYIFPLLAKKMPAFAHDDSHRREHQLMHGRLEAYETYIQEVTKSLGKKSTQQNMTAAGQKMCTTLTR